MAFQLYAGPQSVRGPRSVSAVSISASGIISISGPAIRLFTTPAVQLLFEPDTRLVCIRPAAPTAEGAHAFQAKSKGSAKRLSTNQFLKAFHIDHTATRRYPIRGTDGEIIFGPVTITQPTLDGTRAMLAAANGRTDRLPIPR